MLVPVLLFILGLILLIKGGDWFVDGATGIAQRFHLPEILIGATVVSIGTTLPEVMVSATSAVTGHGEIAYGNAIGSVICNTALIAALTAAVRPGKVDRKSLGIPVAFFFAAAILYAVCAYAFGFFSRPVGFALLAVFLVYMILTVRNALKAGAQAAAAPEAEGEEGEAGRAEKPLWQHVLFLVIGAALIAKALGVPESVIALTFVALGTSLPELVTAVTALAKGHSALSLGNVIGANLFNLVLVSGLATALSPFAVPVEKTVGGVNASLAVDIPVMFLVMAVLTLPALKKGKLSRVQGILLLALYTGFCVFQFVS